MDRKRLMTIARRLLTCPTAPFYEEGVRAVVESICREERLAHRRDSYGNVVVSVGSARHGRPIAFAAHLDHPGFAIERTLGPGRWLARFNGTVAARYFRPGLPVRLMPGMSPAQVARVTEDPKLFELKARRPVAEAPRFGVWEMEDFRVRKGRVNARACDDLMGVAAALGTLVELKRLRAPVHAMALISRAEEVGFQGALTLAAHGRIPRRALVVSLETSKELPPVRMGHGVVIRVGDRASSFGSDATRFLTEVATELSSERGARFRFQRALMPGGACEATAYQEFGFETGAVCIALGNYHNCSPRGTIREEYVSVDDFYTMAQLLERSARRMAEYRTIVGRLPARLRKLLTAARRNLRSK